MTGEPPKGKVFSTRIKIKGKTATVEWNWDRNKLNAALMNVALALSLDEDLRDETAHWGTNDSSWSLVSLVICLMQQITRAPELSSLNAIYNLISSNKLCSEKEWVMFSLALNKAIDADTSKQELLQKNKPIMQLAGDQLKTVCKLLDDFAWFGLDVNPLLIKCILPGGEINHVHDFTRRINSNIREPDQRDCIVLWYDSAQSTYNGIVERHHLYPTQEAYKAALSFDLAPIAREWFLQQLEECTDDDVFACKAMGFSQDISQIGREIENLEQLLDNSWINVNVALRTLCLEILTNPTEDQEDKQNQRKRRANESDLAIVKRELFQALVSSADECKARRNVQYETSRMKSINDKLDSKERHFAEMAKIKAEMNRCSKLLEGNAGLEAIEQLTQAAINADPVSAFPDAEGRLAKEIAKEESAVKAMLENINHTRAHIKEDLKKQQELFAWAKFKDILAESVPPFELVSKRGKHLLFSLGNAEKLIEVTLEMLDKGLFVSKQDCPTPISDEDRTLLNSYARRMASLKDDAVLVEELNEIFREMIIEPEWLTNDPAVYKVNGRALIISEILLKFKLLLNKTPSELSDCNELIISADDVIYVDEDWQTPGISISLSSAFSIRTQGYGARSIDTSGSDAVATRPSKADDATSPGMDGYHGAHGEPGQNAGHVTIHCKKFLGELVIKASGGRGADGQDGGNGAKGSDGVDGTDGQLPSKMQNYWYYSTNLASFVPGANVFDTVMGTTNKLKYGSLRGTVLCYIDYGKQGEKGQNGGAGGNAGRGGQGGRLGNITIGCAKIHGHIDSSTNVCDGEDGLDGKPGSGGEGGKGGKHGYTVARAFEPSNMNPWLWITGEWKEKTALKLELEEVKRTSDKWVMGYKIVEKYGDERESNGEKGKDGLKAKSTAASRKQSVVRQDSVHLAASSEGIGKSKKSEAGSHARSRADQIAQAVELQQEALANRERAVANHEEKTNALRLALNKAAQLKASALRNQTEVEEAEREIRDAEEKAARLKNACERMKQSFEKAESIIMSTTNKQSSQRVNRMVDYQQQEGNEEGTFEDDNFVRQPRQEMSNVWFGEEFDACYSNHTTIAQSTEKNLTGLEILDDLIDRFIAAKVSEDVTQKLSTLTQALVLQINRDEEPDQNENPKVIDERRSVLWGSIKKIILRYLHQPLDLEGSTVEDSKTLAETLVQCLFEINRDVELVGAIQRVVDPIKEEILRILRDFLKEKIRRDESKNKTTFTASNLCQTDEAGLLFRVRVLSWTFDEMEVVFNKFVEFSKRMNPKDVKLCNLLESTFGDYLLSSTREAVEELLSRNSEDNSKNPAAFNTSNEICLILKELWPHCSKRQAKQTTLALFLRQYLKKIEKLDIRKEYEDKARDLFSATRNFSRKNLLFNPKDSKSLETWLFTNPTDSMEAFKFLLKYDQVDLEEMDNVCFLIRDSQKTNKSEFASDEMPDMIQQTFNEKHWEPAVGEVMDAFSSANMTIPTSQELAEACRSFCKLINCFTWKYNRLTFTERLKFCSHLIEELAVIERNGLDLSDELGIRQELDKRIRDLATFIRDTEGRVCGITETNNDDITQASMQTLQEILDVVIKSTMIKESQSSEETKDQTEEKELKTGSGKGSRKRFEVRKWFRSPTESSAPFQTSPILGRKLRRVLFDFDQLHFDKVEELQFFNGALNTLQREHFDDKAKIDYDDLRNEFISHWPSIYLLKWSKPLEEVDERRKHIRSQWEDQFVNRMSNRIADRAKTLRRMDILLAKYACQTSWFLSPGESLDKWRSLKHEAEQDWSSLENLLIKRILGDFAMMKMLFGHVGVQAKKFQLTVIKAAKAAGLDIRDNMVSVDVVTALTRNKARKDLIARQDAWFVTVMDVLLFAMRSAPKLDDSVSLRLAALAENVEILVECGLVGWIGGSYLVGEASDRPIVLDCEKLDAYKSKFSGCSVLAASCGMVRDRLLSALDAVDGTINGSELLVGRLDARIRRNNSVFKHEIESLGAFVTSLSTTLVTIEKATKVRLGDVVDATAHVLDNEHTVNALGIYRDKHWSVLQRIEIWTRTFNNSKTSRSSKPKDVRSWLLQLLDIPTIGEQQSTAQDEALVALRLSVSSSLLNEWFDIRLVSRDVLRDSIAFFCTCSRLLDKIMPKKLDIMSETISQSLSKAQNALAWQLLNALRNRIDQTEDIRKNHEPIKSSRATNQSRLQFLLQEKAEQVATVASFLGRTTNETNQFVLNALCLMSQDSPDSSESTESYVKRFINHLYASKDHLKVVIKKKKVLACLYPTAGQQTSLFINMLEKSVINRWISKKDFCSNNQKLLKLYDWINKTEVSRQKAPLQNENGLWAVFGFELLHEGEKLYTNLVGRQLSESLLSTIVPNSYMQTLKSAAESTVFRKFVSLFYPGFDVRLLDEADKCKENDQVGDARITALLRFKRAFNRAYFFAKRDGREFEWLVWLECTVLPSVKAPGDARAACLENVTNLLFASAECEFDILFQLTVSSRPQQWIHNLIINSLAATISSRYAVLGSERGASALLLNMKADMRALLLANHGQGRKLLKMLATKLDDESRLVTAFAQPIDCKAIALWIAGLRRILQITESELARFAESPIRQWQKIIRHVQLTEQWGSAQLATQLVNVLDRRFGSDVTDRFLELFERRLIVANDKDKREQSCNGLSVILRNMSRHPWTVQMAADLANGQGTDRDWLVLKDEESIKKHANALSKEVLSSEQLIASMKDDVECKALVGSVDQRDKLIATIEQVKRLRNEIVSNGWGASAIKNWAMRFKGFDTGFTGLVELLNVTLSKAVASATSNLVKGNFPNNAQFTAPVDPPSVPFDVTGFLAVASVAVHLEKSYFPRDAQLLAVLLFTSGSSEKAKKRIAQISTGEGKTLITALLAAYHALSNWQGRRPVNVITSSCVLAEANVIESRWFFDAFGIGVTNNCDSKCAHDDDERSRRYGSDVVYGDLSSFQRDELLSEFFDKNVTKGRRAGALIIDEVDSMLLDKGENLLYLSHSIPEMDDLMSVFVDIWSAVQDPRIPPKRDEALHQIRRYVEERMKRGETTVPVCLRPYVERQLLSWIRSAFRAKNNLKAKDTYKVDDVGARSGGMQVVVMDKETGVEQVNMQWTHGLHQFLQLKHGLRLSPVSLKAVFMSNIGFFKSRHDGALYGLTGTLGSAAECELLRHTFDVQFFRMPRFKRRFCWEEAPLVSCERNIWLDNMATAVNAQISKKRAVLVICESIVSAEAVYQKLEKEVKTLDSNEPTSGTVALYVSSFDQDFQERQHKAELQAGDVIVATNLAGRGTDFKVGAEVVANGGLHVIIGYVPSNARVEDQAQGRTGRAGQLGSFQFVVNRRKPTGSSIEDCSDELDRLKNARDAVESRRLENIRTKGLQRIFMEETLFNRFRQEIYEPVKNHLDLFVECAIKKLQLDFLTNQWAVWLDENAERIHRAQQEEADLVSSNFDRFKERCLKVIKVQTATEESSSAVIRFARMPSELLKLGRSYDQTARPDAALVCYETILEEEPNHEAALLHKAKALLQKADLKIKQDVKPLLMRARKALHRRMDIYMAASQIVSKTTNAQLSGSSKGTFNDQMSNLSSLLQIHSSSIEQIIGKPLGSSIAQRFSNETGEARHLNDAIIKEFEARGLLKPFRVSKKVAFSSDDRDVFLKSIEQQDVADDRDAYLDWYSGLEHCKMPCIALLKEKLKSSRRAISKDDFYQIADDCQTAWQKLISEGYIGEEQVTDGWFLSLESANGNETTPSFDDLTEILAVNVLMDWLDRHTEEEFCHAVHPLNLAPDKENELRKALEKNGILVRLDKRSGRLLKPIPNLMDESEEDAQVHLLPSSLQPLAHVLSAWGQCLPEDGIVSRETLPLPANQDQLVNQLWDFLVMNQVIKEPRVHFSKTHCSTKASTEDRLAELTATVGNCAEIQNIFERYSPKQEPITEISFFDLLDYAAANKLKTLGGVTLGISIGAHFVFLIEPSIFNQLKKIYEDEVKKWLNEKRRDNEFEAYLMRVMQALRSSVGDLKTIPLVSATLKPLSGYFSTDQEREERKEELHSFEANAADLVLALESSWVFKVNWSAVVVTALGVAQLAAGITLTACTFGGAAFLSTSLIKEGISDMSFGLRSTTADSFSWGDYGRNKLWSVGLSALTCGIGAYLTQGASAGQAGVAALKGLAGRSLALAVAKEVLVKSAGVLQTLIVSSALERSLTWAKDFVLDNVLKYIQRAVRCFLSSSFKLLVEFLERLKEVYQQQGKTLSEATNGIENLLGKIKQSPKQLAWLDRLSSAASSVADAFGGCFSQAGGVWRAQEGAQKAVANEMFHLHRDPNGLKEMNHANRSSNQAEKLLSWANKVYQIVKFLKHATPVVAIVSHAPVYMENINKELELEVKTVSLEVQREILRSEGNFQQKKSSDSRLTTSHLSDYPPEDEDESSSCDDNEDMPATSAMLIQTSSIKSGTNKMSGDATQQSKESAEWAEYQEKIVSDMEKEILRFIVDKITSAWVQPWLQSKLESSIQSLSARAAKGVASFFNPNTTVNDEGSGAAAAENQQDTQANKSADEETNNDLTSAEKEEMTRKLVDNCVEEETDTNGKGVVRPKNYEEAVESLGSGRTAGLLEMQMVADAMGRPIVIEDADGSFGGKANGDGEPFAVQPNGDESNKNPPIKLRYSKNEDGTRHVELIDENGKVVQVNSSPDDTPNRCLYIAVANAQGCSVDDLLTGVKQHAANNKLAQYLYNNGVDEVLPELRCGRQAETFYEFEQQGDTQRVTRMITSLTKENVGGTSQIPNKHREKIKKLKEDLVMMINNDENLKPEEKEKKMEFINKSHLGHVLMENLGGSGQVKDNNIFLLLGSINQGIYKRMENQLKSYLTKKSNATVHLNIVFNENVPNGNFFCPAEIRFVWADLENEIYFVGPLIRNRLSFVYDNSKTSVYRHHSDTKSKLVQHDTVFTFKDNDVGKTKTLIYQNYGEKLPEDEMLQDIYNTDVSFLNKTYTHSNQEEQQNLPIKKGAKTTHNSSPGKTGSVVIVPATDTALVKMETAKKVDLVLKPWEQGGSTEGPQDAAATQPSTQQNHITPNNVINKSILSPGEKPFNTERFKRSSYVKKETGYTHAHAKNFRAAKSEERDGHPNKRTDSSHERLPK